MPSPVRRQPASIRRERPALVVVICLLLFVGVSSAFYFRDNIRNLHAYGPSGTPSPSSLTSTDPDRCSSIMPVEQSYALIDRLDRTEASFASTTQDVMGQTTEGGEQTTYTQNGVRQIVEQRFYGETGRSIARIYYLSGKAFALIVQNMKYAVP